MNSRERGVPEGDAKETLIEKSTENSALQSCLIDGNAEQTGRERKLRRRSLVLSTLFQAAVLLAVIAVPFFSKAERIAFTEIAPNPPYHAGPRAAHEHTVAPPRSAGQRPSFCLACPPVRPVNPSSTGNHDGPAESEQLTLDRGAYVGLGTECAECINIGNTNGPRPPDPPRNPPIVRITHIDPAMLTERVEPSYPPLARQLRRDGRVELHAIISVDGTIEQLEVVSGDVLFYQSALDAVRRWRYHPTMLNGQAVKVDTYITVIYTMRQ